MNDHLHIDECDREDIVHNYLFIAMLEDDSDELVETNDLFELYDKIIANYTNNERFSRGYIYRDKRLILRVANFRGRIQFLPVEETSMYYQEATNIF